jgi:hypothetical protein
MFRVGDAKCDDLVKVLAQFAHEQGLAHRNDRNESSPFVSLQVM